MTYDTCEYAAGCRIDVRVFDRKGGRFDAKAFTEISGAGMTAEGTGKTPKGAKARALRELEHRMNRAVVEACQNKAEIHAMLERMEAGLDG